MIRLALLAALAGGPAAAQGSIESAPLAPLAAPAPRAPLTPPAPRAPLTPAPRAALTPGGVLAPVAPDPFAPIGATPSPGPGLNPLVVTEPLPEEAAGTAPPPGDAATRTATPPGDTATRLGPQDPAVAALPDTTVPPPDPRFRRPPPGLAPGLPGANGTPGIVQPGAAAPEAPAQLIPPIATALAPGAQLRELDKLTGQIRSFDVAAGTEVQVERLRIKVLGCRAPGDNGTHGTMAFVQIWDIRRNDGPPAFSGWMFAESPALSALDHPRYDVWVLGCSGLARPSAPVAAAPVAPPDDSGVVTAD